MSIPIHSADQHSSAEETQIPFSVLGHFWDPTSGLWYCPLFEAVSALTPSAEFHKGSQETVPHQLPLLAVPDSANSCSPSHCLSEPGSHSMTLLLLLQPPPLFPLPPPSIAPTLHLLARLAQEPLLAQTPRTTSNPPLFCWAQARHYNRLNRQALTDLWRARGVHVPLHFATLTSRIHTTIFGLSPQDHLQAKGLPFSSNHILRDHCSTVELKLLLLAELVARLQHELARAQGYHALLRDVGIAGQLGAGLRQQTETVLHHSLLSLHHAAESPDPASTPLASHGSQIALEDSTILLIALALHVPGLLHTKDQFPQAGQSSPTTPKHLWRVQVTLHTS